MSDAARSLRVDGLAFGWPERPLFDRWSHDFAPGLTWLRGDNGCGKSTLLRLLGGALDPQAGSIQYDGVDARTRPVDYRRRIYWCTPEGPAFEHLRPDEFFGFVARLYPSFDMTLAGALTQRLGLEPFLARRISELSTGSRKKVGVIAALASGSDVFLLDEPLSALDGASASAVKALLASAARQSARVWVVASHEPLDDDAAVRSIALPPTR